MQLGSRVFGLKGKENKVVNDTIDLIMKFLKKINPKNKLKHYGLDANIVSEEVTLSSKSEFHKNW